MPSFAHLNRRYGPWVSLALGVATVAYVRRGLGFAPVAVGVLMLAWIGAAALRRTAPVTYTEPAGIPATPAQRWLRLAQPAAGSLVVGLWQNVLFYLLPLWWASSVPGSWNVAIPAMLAAMALLSCFEHRWRAWVLDRPVVHAAWCAVVLFATLVPAASVFAAPLRSCLAVSAAVASLVAAIAVVPRNRRLGRAGQGLTVLVITAAAAAFVPWAGPVLPAVPVVCLGSGTGTAIRERTLVGATDTFSADTKRVYAWFAVAVPARYRQAVRFEWYRDGERVGRTIETFVVGGRREGFRTWSAQAAPLPGRWRVDLRTDSFQLVARESFVVR